MKGFTKCCVSNAVDETYDDTLWDGSEDDRLVRSEYVEHEGSNCGDGDSDTDWERCIECDIFVYYMWEINSKIFFLSRCFIFGGLSQIWLSTFSLCMHVLRVGS